jgi:chromosome partitioning protein
MKILTIASAKGGSGKSTITGALAVRACQDGAKVAMLDLNYDQGSLTDWHNLRRQAGVKPLPDLDVDGAELPLGERLEALATAHDWAIIDTPPMDMPLIEEAISLADFVLAPTRCGFFDMAAAQVITSMCRRHGVPFGFAINCADAKHATVLKQTMKVIEGMQWPLLAAQVKYRQAWIQALSVGKTGAEISRDAKAEIDETWAEVRNLAEARQ